MLDAKLVNEEDKEVAFTLPINDDSIPQFDQEQQMNSPISCMVSVQNSNSKQSRYKCDSSKRRYNHQLIKQKQSRRAPKPSQQLQKKYIHQSSTHLFAAPTMTNHQAPGCLLSMDELSSATLLGDKAGAKNADPKGGHDKENQMFDFRESLVIATVVSIILLLFACLLLWCCNKTHQIVQDGDLEKGEKLFEEMLNPDYKDAFLNKKTGIYNKSDRKRYIIQKMKEDFKVKQEEERKQKQKEQE